MGVTIRKKMIPIIKGEITLLSNKPNLYQRLFNGFKIFEFNKNVQTYWIEKSDQKSKMKNQF